MSDAPTTRFDAYRVAMWGILLACLAGAAWVLLGAPTRFPGEAPSPGHALRVAPPPRGPVPDYIGSDGFVHLERREGVWWFVDAKGQPFVSLGINHVDARLVSTGVNRADTERRYPGFFGPDGEVDLEGPGAARWFRDVEDQIQGWGFNTLGVHTLSVPSRHDMMWVQYFIPATTPNLGCAVCRGAAGLMPLPGAGGHASHDFPDPFDPATADKVDRWARFATHGSVRDPLLLGYQFADQPLWTATEGYLNPWQSALMRLPADAPGKLVFLDILHERYRSAAAAGATYGVEVRSWAELADTVDWPLPADPKAATADGLVFLPEIARAWYRMLAAALHRYDPNHLVFGDKVEGYLDFPEWLDPIVGDEVDLLYIQWFTRFDEQRDRLDRFYATTGKPVLIGDSGFSTPSRWNEHPKEPVVDTPEQVGREYAAYLEALVRRPYGVGWHWCGWMTSGGDTPGISEQQNRQYGFLDPDGTPHEVEIDAARAANAEAARWHAGSGR